jgi:hypothetical protein
MSRRRRRPPSITIPTYWSPHEALAVFEIVNQIRGLIWQAHGPAIQQAMQLDLFESEDCRLDVPDSEDPF